ncbi:MAG: biotin--[acetyl-CoA-carboxylase] ligase [Proteobacteria bacterium]|nr:biotin--[acetyl-CoA-carboxylase] ligase [Pseudomonadota bacterium]
MLLLKVVFIEVRMGDGENLQADRVSANFVKSSAANTGIDVTDLKSVDSTNSWCLRQCEAGKGLPFICFAQEQTSGRGRRGKQWFMAARSNIAMSVAWSFSAPNQSLQLLPLSIALAIAETLESLGLKQVQIKWPNDVYLQGVKIAGILIETQPVKNRQDDKQLAVVIGVGLNYDMSVFAPDILKKLPALTDVCEQVELQKIAVKPERDDIARSLQENVVAACQAYPYALKENLSKFRARYDYCKDKNVEIILDNKEVLSGVAQGLNDNAELLVLIEGEQRVFNSAEVSVKPVNVSLKTKGQS